MSRYITFFFSTLLLIRMAFGQSPITVEVAHPIADIKSTMWGIFFEDINFAADGGLYAELVKNRSFEFDQPMMGWDQQKSDRFSVNTESGSALIINRGGEDKANPRFARIFINAEQGYGLTNLGYRGMGIREGTIYTLSLLARQQDDSHTAIRIELESNDGSKLGTAHVQPEGAAWKEYGVTFKAAGTTQKAKLNLWFEGRGVMDIDMVSLFPADTWQGRRNGLRADLVQLLADMKPGFLRFPGGCIVEGRDLATRYQWKKTVGDPEDRTTIINRWNTEFQHRPTPDYFQSFGLGFFEYFQLAEDIRAEPLPILNCGMACQFNTGEVVPMDQLDPYIQDALDLIGFANGDPSTPWGKVRADMGHPAPFNLKYLGVGNEQWGPQYFERYKDFVSALKERYPDLTIVTGSGPFPDGELFDYAYGELNSLNAEIVDEHYYRNPQWFLDNATRYDNYNREGPRIFAGEYAAQSVAIASPDNKNNWGCALAEAAFMTGLERNADVVNMCSYAPLFAHVEGWQWTPDLIWFDNLNSYGTPNYYVQKLFSTNKGSKVLPMLENGKAVTGQGGLYASAAVDDQSHEIILKLVNATSKVMDRQVIVNGTGKLERSGTITILSSTDLQAVNSLEHPKLVAPVEGTVSAKGNKLDLSLKPYSLSVVRINMK